MRRIPTIRAVMTPFPHSIEIGAPVTRARDVMEEQGIRHLPVMEEGRLVSVITDREVKLALDPGLGRSPRDDLVVRDLCVPNVYIVEPTEPLDAALMHMAHHRFDAALVVKDGKLAGIFTTTDAFRVLGNLLRTLFPSSGDDAA